MRLFKFIFPGFALLFLTSCYKDEPTSGTTTVNGRVIDYYSKKPIPFADVFITQQSINQMSALGTKQIEVIRTDENGNYSSSFHSETKYVYDACAVADNYAREMHCYSLKPLKENKLDIPLHPFSYIKYNIVNEPPLDPVHISISVPYIATFYAVNDSVIYSKLLQFSGNLVWRISKSGVTETFTQNITTIPNDTITVEIKY